MSNDPAFLFYSSDFLIGVSDLTDEQTGKYIKLLCYQHQKGHMTRDFIIKICGTYDKDIFDKFIQDDDKKYFNIRLDIEINKRKAYSDSRKANRLNKISKTHDKHMENENINVDDIDIEILPTFENFWNEYDKKVGKQKSQREWDKLKQDEKETLMADIQIYKDCCEEKKYMKDPERYLKYKVWNDEHTKRTSKNQRPNTSLDQIKRIAGTD